MRVRGAKFFCDGAMGSWTAAMLQPYSDRPSTKGTLIYNTSDLLAGVTKWKNAGYQISAHAIGDAANRQILDVYQQAGAKAADRFRVEHVQILSEQDLPRFARLGVIPSMQTTHCASDLGVCRCSPGGQSEPFVAWRALKDTWRRCSTARQRLSTREIFLPCSASTPVLPGSGPTGLRPEGGIRKNV